ncbi:MAG: phosphatidylserine decarboxylase family protein [Bacteroidales bacterium]|nr:phosphatidylserine decarboxylase family protein [Bacteroidales bacterium]
MIKIHKEGQKIVCLTTSFILICNVLVFLFIYSFYISIPVLALSLVILTLIFRFFRNPDRTITPDNKFIVSPADGVVVTIEETVEEEYLKDKRIQVSIFMSVHDVHLNRYPVSGSVTYCKYHEGQYLLARHPKSSTLNERSTVVIKTPKSIEVLVRQIAGAVARRVIPYSKEGFEVIQGDELGFIRFGSRVDLFLPLETKIKVKLGQKVKGNLSIIGEF